MQTQAEERFDEYALGASEGEAKRAFEANVKDCPGWSRRLEEARARIALLALAAPAVLPPAAVKARLMRQVNSSRSAAGLQRQQTRFPGWGVTALAAAVVVFAIVTGFLASRNHQVSLRLKDLRTRQAQLLILEKRQAAHTAHARTVLDVLTSPSTVKVPLAAAPTRAVPRGRAFYNPQQGLLFYAANLPRLPSDRTYQLWLVPTRGKPISAGIFNTDARGNGEVLLPSLPSGVPAEAFAVTVEPAGGKPQPTGKIVLIGAVP